MRSSLLNDDNEQQITVSGLGSGKADGGGGGGGGGGDGGEEAERVGAEDNSQGEWGTDDFDTEADDFDTEAEAEAEVSNVEDQVRDKKDSETDRKEQDQLGETEQPVREKRGVPGEHVGLARA